MDGFVKDEQNVGVWQPSLLPLNLFNVWLVPGQDTRVTHDITGNRELHAPCETRASTCPKIPVAHKSVSRASNFILKTRATRSGRSAAVCPGRSSLDLKPPPTPSTAGRVSDPRTPARGKQRRVQPRCPRPDRPTLSRFVAPSQLLRASARHRRRARDGASDAGLANASQA